MTNSQSNTSPMKNLCFSLNLYWLKEIKNKKSHWQREAQVEPHCLHYSLSQEGTNEGSFYCGSLDLPTDPATKKPELGTIDRVGESVREQTKGSSVIFEVFLNPYSRRICLDSPPPPPSPWLSYKKKFDGHPNVYVYQYVLEHPYKLYAGPLVDSPSPLPPAGQLLTALCLSSSFSSNTCDAFL